MTESIPLLSILWCYRWSFIHLKCENNVFFYFEGIYSMLNKEATKT